MGEKKPETASQMLESLNEFLLGEEPDFKDVSTGEIAAYLKKNKLDSGRVFKAARLALNEAQGEVKLAKAREKRLSLQSNLPTTRKPLGLLLDAEKLNETLTDCLFNEGEDTSTAVVAQGIMAKYGFHPERLEGHRETVKDMLRELPDEFHREKGGGMSFLNACHDRHGNHWGEHRNMDQLFTLGQALGLVKQMRETHQRPTEDRSMAKYIVTMSCGHDHEVSIGGPVKDRDRKKAWFEREGLCRDCYRQKKRQEEAATTVVAERRVSRDDLRNNKERIVEEAEHRARLQLEELGDDPDPKKVAAREVFLEALGELRGLSWDAVVSLDGRDYPVFDTSAFGAKSGGNAVVAYIRHVEPYKSKLSEIMEAKS